jgi:hypothetical protein
LSRAGSCRYGQLPIEWHAILKGLKARNSVEGFTAERWRLLIFDAEIFLSLWGPAANSVGWTALDLFGVHPDAPARRYDQMELVPLIGGGEVVSITDRRAIRTRCGSRLIYTRSPRQGAVCLWELGSFLKHPDPPTEKPGEDCRVSAEVSSRPAAVRKNSDASNPQRCFIIWLKKIHWQK